MNLIKESYTRLFPNREFNYLTELEYNRRLGSFNANIKFDQNKIYVNLNLQWKDIDDEIKIGLVQHLLLKVFKKYYKIKYINTINLNHYNNFIKNIALITPKTKTNPFLESSFNRVNDNFFNNLLEQPNLTWGTDSRRKLACYNFHNDTITVSTIFKEVPEKIIDYLVYHELLHKFHQFKHKNGRSFFHTKKFKQDENLYPNKKLIERQIDKIIKNYNLEKRKINQRKNLLDFFR